VTTCSVRSFAHARPTKNGDRWLVEGALEAVEVALAGIVDQLEADMREAA
jgi:hypothetical protein